MANRARIMPKERLFDRIFSMDEEEIGLNAIETYVARLRRKLEGSGVAIRTLRGLGYQLVRSMREGSCAAPPAASVRT